MDKVAIYTLGCKANQADSDNLAEKFLQAGYHVVRPKEKADIYIINTCTVTGKAGYQSRQAVRRFIRRNPGAKIIVTGCDVAVEKEVLESIEGVADVISLRDMVSFILSLSKDVNDQYESFPGFGRSRPFIKIQDGCENFCSYCIVPYTRGKLKSVSDKEIVSKIRKIAEFGYYEAVLTGIHIGAYGKDMGNINLAQLLKIILDMTDIPRLRLSSIEPDEIDDDLLKVISSSKGRIAPHLHVPLQSGCDEILESMKRKYTTVQYGNCVNRVRSFIPDASIGADVITGFPGETDGAFRVTYDFIDSLPITYLHVFSYSDRKGTKSYEMADKVDDAIKRKRTKNLRYLSVLKRREYLKSFLGKEVDVVFDKKKTNGYWKGISENYITVLTKEVDSEKSHNRIKLFDIIEENMIGEEL